MSERDISEKAYKKSSELNIDEIPSIIKKDIDILIANIESNKSLVSALTTSLLKKITTPKQDTRLHRIDFAKGYSVRVLDTHITSPFFKDYFPNMLIKKVLF
jgi:hypothetical protein